jgi:hypothetical protein
MTIALSENTPRIQYTVAAGITQTAFTVNFEFYDEGDLNFYVDGVLKTIATHYTVTGGDGTTGTINTTAGNGVTGISGGSSIIISRDIVLSRITDFPSSGSFQVAKLNTELDRLTAISSDLNDGLSRTIRMPDSDPALNIELPSAADRADKIFKFDTEGNIEAVTANSLIANTIIGANFANNVFTGDGSTVAYTLSTEPGSKMNCQVYVDGVYQEKSTFSISTATLTFTEAPPLNASIEVIVGKAIDSSASDANAVNYDQGGTGYASRTVESKLRDVVSVKDFGAVGNGVTDDTAAFNAAWADSDPQAVYVPVASYVISGTVTGDFFSFGSVTIVSGTVTTISDLGKNPTFNNVLVGGNLTVTGTTTLNGGTLTLGDAASDNVVFGADVNSSIIPNTDDTYDLGSTGQRWKDAYVDGIAYIDTINLNGTAITSTAAELNIVDGDTSASAVTVVDADRVVLNDDGTMKQVAVTDLAAYFDDEITAMPNLITTAATTVGALNSGSITSGFGTIDTGASAITTTGLISGGSLDIDSVLINGANIGHTDDIDLITLSNGVVTVAGELDAVSLDVSGDVDVDGTLEADAITVNGTALATVIAGTTVTNATNAVNATNATNSAHVLVTDNESTNEENLIAFVEGATSTTGNVGLEMDGNFAYNPSTGTVSATVFKGNIDAVDGDFDGTLEADAITIGGTAIGSIYSPIAGGTDILTTGALDAGSITSGFGTINNGASAITTTGVGSFGSLDISGDIDVDGTTNLDVVDIDGAVNIATTLLVTGAATFSDNIVMGTSGKGIDFSATAGTGTSELFNDYEEGTWTPSLGGTTTYTAQLGTYTKIGRMIHVRMILLVNVIGTGSTSEISGLPFAKASGAGAVGAVSSYNGISTSIVTLSPTIATTIIYTLGVSASATGNQTVVSVFQNGTYFEFSATYET